MKWNIDIYNLFNLYIWILYRSFEDILYTRIFFLFSIFLSLIIINNGIVDKKSHKMVNLNDTSIYIF